MDKYAVLKPSRGAVVPEDVEGGQERDRGPADELSLRAIMVSIQDLRGSLEPKLDAVMVDVNLLRVDLKKVLEKVTNAETDIARLQSTSKRLEDQANILREAFKTVLRGQAQDLIGGLKKERNLQVSDLEWKTAALEACGEAVGGGKRPSAPVKTQAPRVVHPGRTACTGVCVGDPTSALR
ncbi:hypothetical protein NDU88_001724 [Pleurodeles waltl]|uniref:Uncharacterized protein n=1 Tax=Pleurodeles waltl TaxID=8319 RepID=A0AAV7TJJ9_PLEWA|nr:hypothetical protein NDU88_001724 [Pleurodeles waltl]